MDLGIISAVLVLVAWGVRTFLFTAPGWWHSLLTFGVFLLIWRIVARGSPAPRAADLADAARRPGAAGGDSAAGGSGRDGVKSATRR